MPRASILSGVALRSAMLILVVLALVMGVAGWAILNTTRTAMAAQGQSVILEDVNLLHDAYTTGGEHELTRFIENAVATRSDKQFAFGLFEPSGRVIAGNITRAPSFHGWGSIEAPTAQSEGDPPFLAYTEKLGNRVIVVARSQHTAAAIADAILEALIASGIVIGGAALVIGYASSRRVSVKLAIIDDTLAEVAGGNTEVRLPIGRSSDQIDHVSRQINAHLDRLSDFMGAMRNTIVAIAHDLKSPLGHAYMLLQQAGAARTPREAASMIDDAQTEMDRLSQIIDTVLRISRIEASNDSSSFATFSASDLVRDLAQTFEPVAEAAGQKLNLRLPLAEVPLFGDRRMIQQMLVNLIENASRYAGPNTLIELALEARPTGPALIVGDTGPGVPAAYRAEVLKPFFRIESERTAPGSGLGLALVAAIAARHHARLELTDNRPGLRATIAFPAVPVRRHALPRAA
ncbi:MAG: HAMP domain-containing sensor histidine kinase [Devosia sp.]